MLRKIFCILILSVILIRPEVLSWNNKVLGSNVASIANQSTQSMTLATVMGILATPSGAYRPLKFNQEMVAKVNDSFIDSLDSNHSIFLKEDVDFLKGPSMQDELSKMLMSGNSDYLKKVSELFLKRVNSFNTEYSQVIETANFDFSLNESYALRDDKTEFPSSLEERSDIIKKSVKAQWLSLRLVDKDAVEIRKLLSTRNKDSVEFQTSYYAKPDAFFNILVSSVTSYVDPHTSYIPPVDQTTFNMSLGLSLEGVGATLQRDSNGIIVVRTLVPGGPAFNSKKVNVGDQIVAVAQGRKDFVNIEGWQADEAVGIIRGPAKSEVRLLLRNNQVEREVSLVREKIKVEEQAAKSKIISLDGRKIGVVRLPTFYQDFEAVAKGNKNAISATSDVRNLISEMKKKDNVDGIIMDLRGNGGGSLVEAVDLTGLFIDVGPVVQIKTNTSIEVEGDSNAGAIWEGPLAVLVDRSSASASEIFAAAIQDHGRGLIIGDNTFGKGTVQTVLDLKDFAAQLRWDGQQPAGLLKFTTAQFYRISGLTTQKYGVTPDVAFPVSFYSSKIGESQYPNALEPDSIPAVAANKDRPLSSIPNFLETLNKNHEKRVKEIPELVWLDRDLQALKDADGKKEISLNEDVRKSEIEKFKREQSERDSERKKLGLPVYSIYKDDGLKEYERPLDEQIKREEEYKKIADSMVEAPVQETAKILIDSMILLK